MGTLAIIGLGLIGSSLGLAIKRAQPDKIEVVGFDREDGVANRSREIGAIDRVANSAVEAVDGASMVLIATPIVNARKVLQEIGPRLRPGTLVTDTASTKVDMLRWAAEFLPAGVHFVGGHPMAGKEQSGPDAAEVGLFEGRPYCIIPSMDASEAAVSAVVGMAQAVGANPFFLDADEHDAYAAAISHVPLVASLALFNLARKSAAWPELATMSGPAFKDLTRLASGSPEMTHDIFMTNRENLRHWLDRYVEQLREMADLIESDEGETLFRNIVETQWERDNFIINPPTRAVAGAATDVPTSGAYFMAMMTGSLFNDRAKDLTEAMEERRRQAEREERLHRRVD